MSEFTFSEYHPLKPNNQVNESIRKRKRSTDSTKSPTKNDQSWPRKSLFQQTWQHIESEIDEVIDSLTEESANNMLNFFKKESAVNEGLQNIPTAMMTMPSYLIPPKIIEKLEFLLKSGPEDENIIYVELEWNQHYNSIHDVCKEIINQILVVRPELEEFNEFIDVLLLVPFAKLISESKIKLMLVIYGLENFDLKFLDKLVATIQSWWNEKLLTGLIIFQSNRFNDNLFHYLPPRSTSCLNVVEIANNFQKDQILGFLEQLISHEEYQFKLHPKFVRRLMLFFDSIEFSFENFRLLLKTHILYFFFKESISWICEEDPEEFNQQLSSNRYLYNRFYDAFGKDPERGYNRYHNIEYFHYKYRELLKNNRTYCLSIQILLKFFKNLKIPTESFFQYYARIYDSDNHDYQKNLLKELLNVSQTPMLGALKELLINFEEINNSLLDVIKFYMAKLEKIIKIDHETNDLKKAEPNQSCEKILNLKSFKSRELFLKEMKPPAKKNQLAYQQWRSEFIEIIAQTLADSEFLREKDLIERLFCNLTSGNDYPPSRQNLNALLRIDNPASFSIMLRYLKEHNDLNLEKWFEYFLDQTKSPPEHGVQIFLNQIANFEWIGLVKRTQFSFTKECFL